ncbi:pectin lyase fold/virulence factor [Fomes fomentarius]|nr:pectin lyase fold/virulence factor [Fomes fomentarius]
MEAVVRLGLLSLLISCAAAWTTFTVPHTDGQDDVPVLAAALSTGNFSKSATILFAREIKYNIFTPIKFPALTNVEVRIEGNLSYPDDIPTIQNIVGSLSFPGSWFTFTGGNNVTLRGSTDPDWGWVDGHGQAWWDAVQQTNRPHGWAFNDITNGVIRDMKLWKPIAWSFSTSGSKNVHVFNNKILAASDTGGVARVGSTRGGWRVKPARSFPFNTDSPGFLAGGGTDLLFENNHVQNGDDCLMVGSGAKNIHFSHINTKLTYMTYRNSYCEGSHGLSIGSLGMGGAIADVQNVLFENVVMNNTLYGARFKSWTGGNGLARNVTWKNIAFFNVSFPIFVTQNYWDQSIGPRPNSTSTNNTHILDFRFENFAGTILDIPGYVEGSCVSDPCWFYVPGATGKEVIIFDLYPDTATNIVAKHIIAATETHSPVRVLCNTTTSIKRWLTQSAAYEKISSDVGFKCWDGLFIPTLKGLF